MGVSGSREAAGRLQEAPPYTRPILYLSKRRFQNSFFEKIVSAAWAPPRAMAPPGLPGGAGGGRPGGAQEAPGRLKIPYLRVPMASGDILFVVYFAG